MTKFELKQLTGFPIITKTITQSYIQIIFKSLKRMTERALQIGKDVFLMRTVAKNKKGIVANPLSI